MSRIVVTGLGVVSSVGQNSEDFWASIVGGRHNFTEAVAHPGYSFRVGAVPGEWTPGELPLRSLSFCDRSGLFALCAAREALAKAGFGARSFATPERVAVVLGNGGGGLQSIQEQYERLFVEHNPRVHPFTIIRAMCSSSASLISLAFGTKGPCFVTSSACASATQAIGLAAQLIRSGVADVAITGGAEAPLARGTLLAWHAMKIVSHDICRPFSRNRDGLTISEGAGILVLESEAHARARGVSPKIGIAGFASNSDSGDIIAPTEEGMARAMRDALRDAGLGPHDIDYINAHGTGTRANDATEAKAVKTVFGADAKIAMSSTKGTTGHALGAAGALEAIATILAMENGTAPPTANFQESDPDCDLDVLPNEARPMQIGAALSNSFAFGGLNATLVFEQL
ncbi:MAG TPA: beta-ketoacyl-[acyl-carrier-protein] synthase family protein [Methylosinus sp.]|jgi:nodulation protein E|uniref:beta-ketoacyl-[acyl-carrier-protein] synthase family protein n=1 Tax=Methylosinus sp. TaxID=427 RepID=UPI002F957302